MTEEISSEVKRRRFGKQRENLHIGVDGRVFTIVVGLPLHAVAVDRGTLTRSNTNEGVIHRVIGSEETVLTDVEVTAGCTVE